MQFGKLASGLILITLVDLSLATITPISNTTFHKREIQQQFQDLEFFNKIIDFLASGDGTTISLQTVSDKEKEDLPDLWPNSDQINGDLSTYELDSPINSDTSGANQIDYHQPHHHIIKEEALPQPITEIPFSDDLLRDTESFNFSSTSAEEKPLLQFGAGIYFEKKIKKVEEEKDCGEEEEEEEEEKKKKRKKFWPFNVDVDDPHAHGNDTSTLSNAGKFHIDSTYLVSQASFGSHNLFKSSSYDNNHIKSETHTNHSKLPSSSLSSPEHYHQEKHEYVPAFPNSAHFNNSERRRKVIRKRIRKSLNGTTTIYTSNNNNTVAINGKHKSSKNFSNYDSDFIQSQVSNTGNVLSIGTTLLIVCADFIIYLLY